MSLSAVINVMIQQTNRYLKFSFCLFALIIYSISFSYLLASYIPGTWILPVITDDKVKRGFLGLRVGTYGKYNAVIIIRPQFSRSLDFGNIGCFS